MATVIIDSNEFFSYASKAEADEYLSAHMAYATWAALDDDSKGRALITASRLLDRQRWIGAPYEADQVYAFPRTGLSYDGTAIVPTSLADIPIQVVYATIEIALLLAQGEEIEAQQNTSQKIASLAAGSVSISYFRGAEGIAKRFPQVVMELIGQWLLNSGRGLGGMFVSGVDGCTIFSERKGRTRGF